MMGRWGYLLSSIGDAAHVIKIARGPLIVSICAGLALFVPDQTREVYRILAQPARAFGVIQLVFAVLTVIAATGVSFIVSRILLSSQARITPSQSSFAGYLSRWVPHIVAALISFGLSVGLALAS